MDTITGTFLLLNIFMIPLIVSDMCHDARSW